MRKETVNELMVDHHQNLDGFVSQISNLATNLIINTFTADILWQKETVKKLVVDHH